MTYSIIARCPRTGRIGQGIATFAIATGGRFDGFLSNVGICKTMAIPVRGNDVLGVNLLAAGYTVEAALALIAANDAGFEHRQIAIMDMAGHTAAHTGKARPWCGHLVGPGYVATGNMLGGPEVVEGIVRGFLADPDATLEHRLIVALEGGRDAGGQRGPDKRRVPERSAAIRVSDRSAFPVTDLRIDYDEAAVDALRRLFDQAGPFIDYYGRRDREPASAQVSPAIFDALQPGS